MGMRWDGADVHYRVTHSLVDAPSAVQRCTSGITCMLPYIRNSSSVYVSSNNTSKLSSYPYRLYSHLANARVSDSIMTDYLRVMNIELCID